MCVYEVRLVHWFTKCWGCPPTQNDNTLNLWSTFWKRQTSRLLSHHFVNCPAKCLCFKFCYIWTIVNDYDVWHYVSGWLAAWLQGTELCWKCEFHLLVSMKSTLSWIDMGILVEIFSVTISMVTTMEGRLYWVYHFVCNNSVHEINKKTNKCKGRFGRQMQCPHPMSFTKEWTIIAHLVSDLSLI